MKAITIKQPWASLIIEGVEISYKVLFKDIENRTWKTNFRGRVLIHAAAKSWTWHRFILYLYDVINPIYLLFPETRAWLESLPTGKIIGSVEIIDCVINHPSIWAEKSEIKVAGSDGPIFYCDKPIYNWVLKNPILFDKPIPCKGKLSFWEIDECKIERK